MARKKVENMTLAEKILAEAGELTYQTVMCGAVPVLVRRCIPMRDYAEIVENVCAACFDENGEYRPYVREYMLNIEILRKFTNIEMPDDINACLAIVDAMCNNAYTENPDETWMDEIEFKIDGYSVLRSDVEKRIKYELDKYERETHEMVQRIANKVRSLSLLADEAFGNLGDINVEDENNAQPGSIVADDDEKIISMPVVNHED